MKDENSDKRALLKFPCDFTIKVIGKGDDEFESTVLMIIHRHFPNLGDRAIQSRNSEYGKYRALSITIHADTKEQMDSLYRELSACPQVIMAL